MAKNKIRIFFIIFWGLLAKNAAAQSTPAMYLIYFSDKNGTPHSLSNPNTFLSQKSIQRRLNQNIALHHRDLPVAPQYVDSLRNKAAKIWYTTKWLNGAIISADSTQLQVITSLPFVVKHELLRDTETPTINGNEINNPTVVGNYNPPSVLQDSNIYGSSWIQNKQIGANLMHQQGYTGEGITIAVLDAGFRNVHQHEATKHLFTQNRILGTYDFVEKENSVFEDSPHGAQVLSCIAAYLPNKLIGTAYKANFYLFRTEDAATEYKIECANWVVAAERADSLGVDIITTSLGYHTFDNAAMNYDTTDLNGKTAFISRAATMASHTGMLLLQSAANLGNSSYWGGKIAVPADADSIVTVGAVNASGNYAGFSSRGFTADGRIKPNITAMGQQTVVMNTNNFTQTVTSNGTSFSTPVACGLAAGLWQAFPTLTNMQVLDILQRSASQYNAPDKEKGYGIPSFMKAMMIATLKDSLKELPKEYEIFPNYISDSETLCLKANHTVWGKSAAIEVFNSKGKLVAKEMINPVLQLNYLRLNTAKWSSGMYVLRINKNQSVKLVKQ
jgi:hypothetical protein